MTDHKPGRSGEVYLVTLPERVWHWGNAALFITLAVTGMLMHASARIEWVSLGALITVHHWAAALFVISFGFWLGYQVFSGRIRHYLRVERDLPVRLIFQAKFYLLDIFKKAPHPYPVSEEMKFNPLQRLTYAGLMFGLIPLQIVTGAIMYGFTLRVEWIQNLPAFQAIALAHAGLSYVLTAFLVGHIYLATTGDTPLSLARTMITGYHSEHCHGKESQ